MLTIYDRYDMTGATRRATREKSVTRRAQRRVLVERGREQYDDKSTLKEAAFDQAEKSLEKRRAELRETERRSSDTPATLTARTGQKLKLSQARIDVQGAISSVKSAKKALIGSGAPRDIPKASIAVDLIRRSAEVVSSNRSSSTPVAFSVSEAPPSTARRVSFPKLSRVFSRRHSTDSAPVASAGDASGTVTPPSTPKRRLSGLFSRMTRSHSTGSEALRGQESGDRGDSAPVASAGDASGTVTPPSTPKRRLSGLFSRMTRSHSTGSEALRGQESGDRRDSAPVSALPLNRSVYYSRPLTHREYPFFMEDLMQSLVKQPSTIGSIRSEEVIEPASGAGGGSVVVEGRSEVVGPAIPSAASDVGFSSVSQNWSSIVGTSLLPTASPEESVLELLAPQSSGDETASEPSSPDASDLGPVGDLREAVAEQSLTRFYVNK